MPGVRCIHEQAGLLVPPNYERKKGKKCGRLSKKKLDANGKPVLEEITRLEEITGDDFHPYWTEALADLLTDYRRICAYSGFRIHTTGSPSVDHMIPKSKAWDRVYAWSNYRLASLRLNGLKNDSSMVLDPFDVQPGWFALDLTLGQVIAGPVAEQDPELKARVEDTISKLHLWEFDGDRLQDITDYETGEIGYRRLCRESPFVAAELSRQGKLKHGDGPFLINTPP